MPWYVYLAFKQLFPTGKGFSFFALMAIVGVTLGVMVLVVVETVMNGFENKSVIPSTTLLAISKFDRPESSMMETP